MITSMMAAVSAAEQAIEKMRTHSFSLRCACQGKMLGGGWLIKWARWCGFLAEQLSCSDRRPHSIPAKLTLLT